MCATSHRGSSNLLEKLKTFTRTIISRRIETTGDVRGVRVSTMSLGLLNKITRADEFFSRRPAVDDRAECALIQHADKKVDAPDRARVNPNIFCKISFPASLHERMIIVRCKKKRKKMEKKEMPASTRVHRRPSGIRN